MKRYTCDICGAEIKESTAENGVTATIPGRHGFMLNVRCFLEIYQDPLFCAHNAAKRAHICYSCVTQILKITWGDPAAIVNPRVKELWGVK